MAKSKYTIEDLQADLAKNKYTPKTQAQLAQEAAARYDSIYAQKNLAAQQTADASALALDNQLASLGTAYAAQREASTQQFNQAYSQLSRQATSRGMGRSSYNNANLGNISVAGTKAQQDIANAETAAQTGIENQKAMLATQLAQQLQQYAISKTSDTNAYLDDLLNREYERTTDAADRENAIKLQIYQLMQNERRSGGGPGGPKPPPPDNNNGKLTSTDYMKLAKLLKVRTNNLGAALTDLGVTKPVDWSKLK